mmetsp:Transcript_29423/g.59874  ORF Transcript_29423/g.59874 Transcript_29423/m.59874 type:complete len:211 (+) Transcript_29423:943-1575(+)
MALHPIQLLGMTLFQTPQFRVVLLPEPQPRHLRNEGIERTSIQGRQGRLLGDGASTAILPDRTLEVGFGIRVGSGVIDGELSMVVACVGRFGIGAQQGRERFFGDADGLAGVMQGEFAVAVGLTGGVGVGFEEEGEDGGVGRGEGLGVVDEEEAVEWEQSVGFRAGAGRCRMSGEEGFDDGEGGSVLAGEVEGQEGLRFGRPGRRGVSGS